jgi:hypothetical protein
MKFPPGQLYATPRALAAIERAGQDPYQFILRHCNGEHGKVTEKENDDLTKCGLRVMSMFETALHESVWVTTEPDRWVTTISVPEDFAQAA